jgi:GH25 family lysozyme M1 (1,4-beta-N-acetylmuramidase)
MFHLVDVSHHQNPASLDWAGMRAAGCDGCIARLTYGLMHDKKAAEHIKRARDVGMIVGAYHFSRVSQSLGDQIDAFTTAASLAGYGKPEDLVPVLDVEDDTEKNPLAPEQSESFHTLATLMELSFGRPPYCYITQRDWGRLGKPQWVLDLPLWVAHYAKAGVKEPATPAGKEWEIWQCTVAPFGIPPVNGYRDVHPQIDQNRARRLRFLSGRVVDAEVAEGDEQVPLRAAEMSEQTSEFRARVLESVIRAEATALAASSGAELLGEGKHGKDTLT